MLPIPADILVDHVSPMWRTFILKRVGSTAL